MVSEFNDFFREIGYDGFQQQDLVSYQEREQTTQFVEDDFQNVKYYITPAADAYKKFMDFSLEEMEDRLATEARTKKLRNEITETSWQYSPRLKAGICSSKQVLDASL